MRKKPRNSSALSGMADYLSVFSSRFQKQIKKVRDKITQGRIKNKVQEILANPYHYKTLRNVLKGKRRTHIGSFVMIFEISEQNKVIIFHDFLHHDSSYR